MQEEIVSIKQIMEEWLKENNFNTFYLIGSDEMLFVLCEDYGIKCVHGVHTMLCCIQQNMAVLSGFDGPSINLSNPMFFDILKLHIERHTADYD